MKYEKPGFTSTLNTLEVVLAVQAVKGPYFADSLIPNDPRPTTAAYEADE